MKKVGALLEGVMLLVGIYMYLGISVGVVLAALIMGSLWLSGVAWICRAGLGDAVCDLYHTWVFTQDSFVYLVFVISFVATGFIGKEIIVDAWKEGRNG